MPKDGVRLIVMPLTFAAVGLGLLIYGCFADLNVLAVVLAAAAMLAVMGRLIFTFRDNVRMLLESRDEALHDSLTGLLNRRALSRDLARAIPRAGTSRPVVLVLFDLDGFKLYNDTFGHPAGDALLVRLGQNLATYLDGRGTAYRMGGDEFCALFEPGEQVAEPIVAGAAVALSEQGEGFSITSSHGSIVLPLEADDAADALRIADRRMYMQKNAGRTSASRQSRDVLVRALAERNPDLSSHMHDVADLAERTARRLALADEAVTAVSHAAELHDVGKVAIPDEILSQAGAADPRGVRVHPQPHADRRAHHRRGAGADRGGQDRALQPRALGRQGLSRCAQRRRHPAGLTHHLRGRLVRCHDFGAPLQHPPFARRRL